MASKRRILYLFILIWPLLAGAEDYHAHLNAGAAYNDNVTRGANDWFRRGDFAYRLGTGGGVDWQTGERSGVSLESQVEANQFERYERLSSLRGSLLTRALFKPFDGFSAPWLALESEASVVGHKDSALRDRWEWNGRAVSGVRLSDHFSASLGYQYQISRGSQWGVWNTETHRLLVGGEYEFSSQIKFFLNYQLGVGKFVAGAAALRPGWFFPSYDRSWRDKALEAEVGAPVYAYRMDGVEQQISLGAAVDLGHHWRLALSGQYFALDGEAGVFYQGLGANAGIDYRF